MFWAKALAIFLVVEWWWRLRASLSLLWASFWGPLSCFTTSLGENPIQILDERRRLLWASQPP